VSEGDDFATFLKGYFSKFFLIIDLDQPNLPSYHHINLKGEAFRQFLPFCDKCYLALRKLQGANVKKRNEKRSNYFEIKMLKLKQLLLSPKHPRIQLKQEQPGGC